MDARIRAVNPPGLAAPGGHYSHAVVAGGLVYVSGQLPVTPAGERLVGAAFDVQARQVLANVAASPVQDRVVDGLQRVAVGAQRLGVGPVGGVIGRGLDAQLGRDLLLDLVVILAEAAHNVQCGQRSRVLNGISHLSISCMNGKGQTGNR